jgi:hypothetical protein
MKDVRSRLAAVVLCVAAFTGVGGGRVGADVLPMTPGSTQLTICEPDRFAPAATMSASPTSSSQRCPRQAVLT